MSLPGTDAQLVRDLTASSATPLTGGTVILVAPDGRLDDGGPLHAAATAAILQGATVGDCPRVEYVGYVNGARMSDTNG